MTEFWNGHGQDSKSILQHDDQHGNNTKLIQMKGSYRKYTHTHTHAHAHTLIHAIFLSFRELFTRIVVRKLKVNMKFGLINTPIK